MCHKNSRRRNHNVWNFVSFSFDLIFIQIFHRGPIGDDCFVNDDARLNDDVVVGRPIGDEPFKPLLFFLDPNL